MKRNEKLVYENEMGQSIEFSIWSSFFPNNIEGIDGLKNIIYSSSSPGQDGTTYLSSSLNIRDIIIKGSIRTDVDRNRAYLLSTINPKLRGKLIYSNDDTNYYINCIVENAPVITKNVYSNFLVSFYCPNPYWNDGNLIREEIITWIGGFTFPFSFSASFASKGDTSKNIINDGVAESPIEIIFKGPAVNPKVINISTGEFIRVKRTLSSDDTLVINTEFGNKKVEIIKADGTKQNAFNYIDLKSTFFQLKTGDNILQYSTDGLDPSSVSISYKNRYVGV